jgi:hypothetical protein
VESVEVDRAEALAVHSANLAALRSSAP